MRKSETDFTPYETVALIHSALEDKVALYVDEIIALVSATYRIYKPTDKMTAFINACISLGEKQGWFLRSVSDRISLA